MRRKLLIAVAAFLLLLPLTAMAQDAPAPPMLQEISFKNAVTDETFSPYTYEYLLTLEDPSVPPTLASYKIDGKANIFVTYNLDEARHQTGITVTLAYDNGTVIYTFRYKNAQVYQENDNNLLAAVECPLCEVYPALNDSDTSYKLYIPKDMTVLHLTAVTRDIGAYCDVPSEITLGKEQEPNLKVTVTASDGEKREYDFKIKRLEMTGDEVKALMESPDFVSLARGEQFYRNPVFYITLGSALAALLLFALFIRIAKRLTVKAQDEDEKEFFA